MLFFVRPGGGGGLELLDGDKIMALLAGFVARGLATAALDLSVGVVQARPPPRRRASLGRPAAGRSSRRLPAPPGHEQE